MDNKKDILNQVNNVMNIGELKRETKNLIETFSSIAEINKTMYDEMINQGFNEQQAFKFATDYTLRLLFNGNSNSNR